MLGNITKNHIWIYFYHILFSFFLSFFPSLFLIVFLFFFFLFEKSFGFNLISNKIIFSWLNMHTQMQLFKMWNRELKYTFLIYILHMTEKYIPLKTGTILALMLSRKWKEPILQLGGSHQHSHEIADYLFIDKSYKNHSWFFHSNNRTLINLHTTQFAE